MMSKRLFYSGFSLNAIEFDDHKVLHLRQPTIKHWLTMEKHLQIVSMILLIKGNTIRNESFGMKKSLFWTSDLKT